MENGLDVFRVSTWLIMIPALYVLAWNTPESVGLLPDGENKENTKNNKDETIQGLNLSQALKEKSFYILAAMWFGMAMLVTTLHFYQVTILTNQGITADFAAGLFTVSAIAMVFLCQLWESFLTIIQQILFYRLA